MQQIIVYSYLKSGHFVTCFGQSGEELKLMSVFFVCHIDIEFFLPFLTMQEMGGGVVSMTDYTQKAIQSNLSPSF